MTFGIDGRDVENAKALVQQLAKLRMHGPLLGVGREEEARCRQRAI